MGKKKICYVSFIIICVVNNGLYSQATNSGVVIWGGGGVAIPINESEFTNSYKTHFNFSTSIGYVLNEKLQLRFDYQYNRFKNSNNSIYITPEIGVTGKVAINSYKADFMVGSFRQCGCIQHYGVIGLGIYSVSVTKKIDNMSVTDSEVYLGFGAGFGLSLGLVANFRLFLEGQYHYILNDGNVKGYLPIKAGLSFQIPKKQ